METIIIGTLEEARLRLVPGAQVKKHPRRLNRTFTPKDPTEGFIFFRPEPFFDWKRVKSQNGLFVIHDQFSRTVTAYDNKGHAVYLESLAYRNRAGQLYEHKFDTPPRATPSPLTVTLFTGFFSVSKVSGIKG